MFKKRLQPRRTYQGRALLVKLVQNCKNYAAIQRTKKAFSVLKY